MERRELEELLARAGTTIDTFNATCAESAESLLERIASGETKAFWSKETRGPATLSRKVSIVIVTEAGPLGPMMLCVEYIRYPDGRIIPIISQPGQIIGLSGTRLPDELAEDEAARELREETGLRRNQSKRICLGPEYWDNRPSRAYSPFFFSYNLVQPVLAVIKFIPKNWNKHPVFKDKTGDRIKYIHCTWRRATYPFVPSMVKGKPEDTFMNITNMGLENQFPLIEGKKLDPSATLITILDEHRRESGNSS